MTLIIRFVYACLYDLHRHILTLLHQEQGALSAVLERPGHVLENDLHGRVIGCFTPRGIRQIGKAHVCQLHRAKIRAVLQMILTRMIVNDLVSPFHNAVFKMQVRRFIGVILAAEIVD